MSATTKTGAIMLMTGGIVFVIFVFSGTSIVLPLDFMMNAAISVGNIFAFKEYRDRGSKLGMTASILLLITEAAWIAIPIIILVPVALLLLAMYHVKSVNSSSKRIPGIILALVGLGLTVLFIPVR
jgi:hypothetical protein